MELVNRTKNTLRFQGAIAKKIFYNQIYSAEYPIPQATCFYFATNLAPVFVGGSHNGLFVGHGDSREIMRNAAR